jgi:pre-mRNA 3'-end-processing factor FIP1
VEVKVGEQAPSVKEVDEGGEPKAAPAPVNPYDYDIASMEDKPWRKPGADISDWFNYGFNEETWQAYSEKQNELRRQNQNRATIQVIETDRGTHSGGGENHSAQNSVGNPNAQSSFPPPGPPFGMNMNLHGSPWVMGMNTGMGNPAMGNMGMMKGMSMSGSMNPSNGGPESGVSHSDGVDKDRDGSRDVSGHQGWNPELGPMDLSGRGGGGPHQDMFRALGGPGSYNPDNMSQMQMYGRGLPPGMRPPAHVFPPGPPPQVTGRGQNGAWGQPDIRAQQGGQGGQERMERERERERANNERDRERDRERERDRKRGREDDGGRVREDEKRRKEEDRLRDERPRDRERDRDRYVLPWPCNSFQYFHSVS